LVKLLDLFLIAEAVAPPPAQIIYAAAFHALEQLPATICGAHEFLLLLGLCFLGAGRAVLRDFLGYYRDAA
jgi:hypothetical protein